MNLFDQISEAIKQAMLAREKVRLEALRSVKKEFLEAKTAKGSHGELSDEQAVKIIQKLVKQRRESATIYRENGRLELAEAELAEAEVLEQYLPKQLSTEELLPIVRETIAELGITDVKQMGRAIGQLQAKLAGQADGKVLASLVRETILSNQG